MGPGLEGELIHKWTRYKARNAVERDYVWSLHCEKDLGVPLAPAAMDWQGCYTDPDKKKGDKEKSEEEKEMENENSPRRIPEKLQLHLHKEDLVNWKRGLGDMAAYTLQT